MGPTGGYLMAYPFAALLAGYLAERGFDRRHATTVLAMLAGLIVIYACGVLWLGLFVSTASSGPIGISAAPPRTGFYPFVAADILKVLLAAGIMPALWRLIGR
jgi:biotin transport system substrate-specific component